MTLNIAKYVRKTEKKTVEIMYAFKKKKKCLRALTCDETLNAKRFEQKE